MQCCRSFIYRQIIRALLSGLGREEWSAVRLGFFVSFHACVIHARYSASPVIGTYPLPFNLQLNFQISDKDVTFLGQFQYQEVEDIMANGAAGQDEGRRQPNRKLRDILIPYLQEIRYSAIVHKLRFSHELSPRLHQNTWV